MRKTRSVIKRLAHKLGEVAQRLDGRPAPAAVGTWVKSVEPLHTGGGVMVDYCRLWNGMILGVSDECVVLYRDEDQVNDGTHVGQLERAWNAWDNVIAYEPDLKESEARYLIRQLGYNALYWGTDGHDDRMLVPAIAETVAALKPLGYDDNGHEVEDEDAPVEVEGPVQEFPATMVSPNGDEPEDDEAGEGGSDD
jgi:hypothetical protein